jgi:predicted alpha/beta superfamily hydrolase
MKIIPRSTSLSSSHGHKPIHSKPLAETLPGDSVQIGTGAGQGEAIGEAALKDAALKGAGGLPGKPAQGGTYTGNIRMHENFHSNILDNDRNVLVYLPPGYNPGDGRRYPVVYMSDGQNLFNRETAFGGTEWGVDETAEKLMRQGLMKEAIIVGVYNTPDRMSEYTPVPDPRHGGGKAEKYEKFLIQELMPFINSNYRTKTGPMETGIAGSSLGGLLALHARLKHPDVFGLVGPMSPSIWWADKNIIKQFENAPKPDGPAKIWLDIGTCESEQDDNHNGIPDAVENTREMGNTLLKKGYVFGRELFYYEEPGAGHNEHSWANRMDKMLMTLLPKEE